MSKRERERNNLLPSPLTASHPVAAPNPVLAGQGHAPSVHALSPDVMSLKAAGLVS